MKATYWAALLLTLVPSANAGIMASWEVHILELQIVSCAAPTLQNVDLLPRHEGISSADAVAALPFGRIVRARVIRSRVIEEFLDDLYPPKVHAWQRGTSQQPVAYFLALPPPPNASGTGLSSDACIELRPGRVVQLVTTSETDCDTGGRMDLCLFSPLSVLREPTAQHRRYAAQ